MRDFFAWSLRPENVPTITNVLFTISTLLILRFWGCMLRKEIKSATVTSLFAVPICIVSVFWFLLQLFFILTSQVRDFIGAWAVIYNFMLLVLVKYALAFFRSFNYGEISTEKIGKDADGMFRFPIHITDIVIGLYVALVKWGRKVHKAMPRRYGRIAGVCSFLVLVFSAISLRTSPFVFVICGVVAALLLFVLVLPGHNEGVRANLWFVLLSFPLLLSLGIAPVLLIQKTHLTGIQAILIFYGSLLVSGLFPAIFTEYRIAQITNAVINTVTGILVAGFSIYLVIQKYTPQQTTIPDIAQLQDSLFVVLTPIVVLFSLTNLATEATEYLLAKDKAKNSAKDM